MKSSILDLYFVFIFVILAHITESYKVFIIDKSGQLARLQDTHTSKHSLKTIKDKIALLSNTLRKSKKHTSRSHKSRKKTRHSPVIYSNGRYVLDLDKIDVKDVKHVTNKPLKENDYSDTSDNFRDYYEFININDRRSPGDDRGSSKKKSKKKHSRRKLSQILFANKDRFRSRDRHKESHYGNKKNRFKIIDNKLRTDKFGTVWTAKMWEKTLNNLKKNKLYKVYSETENEFSDEQFDSGSGITQEQQETEESSADKSPESAANYYLQGNQFLDVMAVRHKPNKNKRDSETEKDSSRDKIDSSHDKIDSSHSESDSDSSDSDYRRRLPSFMPKRYHWDIGDMKKLGYFWFNGNRGRFPAPMNIN